MTKIALITASTKTEANEVNDVAGLYPDNWVFTEKEKALFGIVNVVETPVVIEAKKVKIKKLTKAKTLNWTDKEPERKDAWEDAGGKLREIKVNPKYDLKYENGEFGETYSRHSENLETIIEIE